MIVQPASLEDLTRILSDANARGEPVRSINLRALDRVVEYAPEDMTVTVEAGATLAMLRERLAQHGQWLPIDPPNAAALTIGGLLAMNLSGPRRFGYGTIRDCLIGTKVALADGRVIKSGGKVVKNVAGYDLAKLFIGSHGSLGVIVEATFKLRPLPEAEEFVQAQCDSLEQAGQCVDTVLASETTPVILDLHNCESNAVQASCFTLVVGFAGTREEVGWQMTKAGDLGFKESATLDYEKNYWNSGPSPRRVSVLPSRTVETIRGLGDVRFVARAGNGVIYYRGGPEPVKDKVPTKLMSAVKTAFDPKHILPELPL